jgi:hypothetical protein
MTPALWPLKRPTKIDVRQTLAGMTRRRSRSLAADQLRDIVCVGHHFGGDAREQSVRQMVMIAPLALSHPLLVAGRSKTRPPPRTSQKPRNCARAGDARAFDDDDEMTMDDDHADYDDTMMTR